LSSLLEARLDGEMIRLPGSSDAKQADPFEPVAQWPEAG
jgi:hypothetical protein